LLSGKKPKKKIVVAVIDSGIDTAHEDLKPVLWNNKKEIPGNQIDDDKNGYVDDVHGWNFIGGKDGKNVGKDSYEAARVYYKYKKLFGDSVVNETQLTTEKKEAYRLYQRAKFQLESQAKEAAMYVLVLKDIVERLPAADSILQVAMGKKTFTGDDLQQFTTSDPAATKARSNLLGLFQQTRQMESTNTENWCPSWFSFTPEKNLRWKPWKKSHSPTAPRLFRTTTLTPKTDFMGTTTSWAQTPHTEPMFQESLVLSATITSASMELPIMLKS